MKATIKPGGVVIGVDTHKQSHTASMIDGLGTERACWRSTADDAGHATLLQLARRHSEGQRLWAIEGTGSYGRGLTTFLLAHDEAVVEIDRPARPARRNGAKNDRLDATRAAREALSRPDWAAPRCRGDREALRVLLRTRRLALEAYKPAINHLKALVVTAPVVLHDRLTRLATAALVKQCTQLRTHPRQDGEYRATVLALRATARRAWQLWEESIWLKDEIEAIVRRLAPCLLAEKGVGPITGGEVLCAWSHRGRLRSEAAFAMLAGVAPIPASSGQVTRYRLNRGGDRQLNRALYTIVLSRLGHDDETKRYAARRTAEGKTPREIRRCLKRHLARRLFKLLETMPMPT